MVMTNYSISIRKTLLGKKKKEKNGEGRKNDQYIIVEDQIYQ